MVNCRHQPRRKAPQHDRNPHHQGDVMTGREIAGWAGVALATTFFISTASDGFSIGHWLTVIALPIGWVAGNDRGHTPYWILNWVLWLNVFGLIAVFYRPKAKAEAPTQ